MEEPHWLASHLPQWRNKIYAILAVQDQLQYLEKGSLERYGPSQVVTDGSHVREQCFSMQPCCPSIQSFLSLSQTTTEQHKMSKVCAYSKQSKLATWRVRHGSEA